MVKGLQFLREQLKTVVVQRCLNDVEVGPYYVYVRMYCRLCVSCTLLFVICVHVYLQSSKCFSCELSKNFGANVFE